MKKSLYCIGIGGIGISSLAQYYRILGWRVSGSDSVASEMVYELLRFGINVRIGHSARMIDSPDLVVYSAAVSHDDVELKMARRRGIKTLSYAEALGELTKNYYTIAVSGSHGKSTTTAFISLILIKAGLDPTVIIGTKLKEFGGKNFRFGKSRYLVIEADEWNRSFYNYYPDLIVLTNIDKEHLDTYKTAGGVVRGFAEYLENLKVGGYLVGNGQDKNIVKISKKSGGTVILYNQQKIAKHTLWLPGAHNQWNAEAAWTAFRVVANNANISQNNAKKIAEKVFKNYHGAWRRFEKLTTYNPQLKTSEIYSDYAHHPTEIKATLAAFREKFPKKRIVCVFQPHQQDRLNRLFKEFMTAFDEADLTVLLPVYLVKGREYRQGKTSLDLVKVIHRKDVLHAQTFNDALKIVRPEFMKNSVVIFTGAGDMDSWVRKYLTSGKL